MPPVSPGQSDDIDVVVRTEIRAILHGHGRDVGEISDRDALSAELGFSSSQLAELVSRIGFVLQSPPVTRVTAITDLVTVGDLVRAWRRALAAESSLTGPDELRASRDRARARRDGTAER